MATTIARRAAITLVGIIALGALATPVAWAGGDPPPCRVRNVTQDTTGRSFTRMVAAAVDDDRLLVRGSCLARGVRIDASITIRGAGDQRPVLDARGAGRVLYVTRRGELTLRHLVVTGGFLTLTSQGAGIHNRGRVTLIDSVVRGNRAEWGGGGIHNQGGDLTLVDSVVRNNVGLVGGGIQSYPNPEADWSRLTLIRSVVRDNMADRSTGGGIYNAGDARLRASRVTGNGAGVSGGGIFNGGMGPPGASLILRASVVSGNGSWEEGGGIHNYDSDDSTVALLEGSTVTGNTPDDCYGTTAC